MTKNEKRAVIGVLQLAHDWCASVKATDYANLLSKFMAVTQAHATTEEHEHGKDH